MGTGTEDKRNGEQIEIKTMYEEGVSYEIDVWRTFWTERKSPLEGVELLYMGRRARNCQKRYSFYEQVVIKKDDYTSQKSQTIGQSLMKDAQHSVKCFLNIFHSDCRSFLNVQDSASNMNGTF